MAAAKKQRTDEAAIVKTAELKFDKEQIVGSARYRNRRDLMDALLEAGKKYTFETVDEMIEEYQKGQVK